MLWTEMVQQFCLYEIMQVVCSATVWPTIQELDETDTDWHYLYRLKVQGHQEVLPAQTRAANRHVEHLQTLIAVHEVRGQQWNNPVQLKLT